MNRPRRILAAVPHAVRRGGWRAVIGCLVLLAVLAGVGEGLARVRVDTGIDSLLPAGDPATAGIEAKAKTFGGDPIAVLLESHDPGQLVVDPAQLERLLGLEGSLSRVPDVAAVYGPATVLNQIAGSAQNLLAQIGGRRDAVRRQAEDDARKRGESESQVKAAGDQAEVAVDQRYGPLLVQGLPAGLPTLRNPAFARTVIYQPTGQPRAQWHFIVPNATTVAVLVRPRQGLDQAGTARLVDQVRSTVAGAGLSTTRVTVTGVPVITAAFADRVLGELPLLAGIALAGCALVLLGLPWLGRRRPRLWPLAVTAGATAVVLSVFGWSGMPVSLGVIALLPILLGIGSDFPLYLAQRAGRRQVLAAALAGAAGAAALAISPLPLVRQLGLALAAGLVLIVGIGALCRRWMPGDDGQLTAVPARTAAPRGWQRAVAVVVMVVVAAGGWAALAGLRVEANPEQLARGLPVIADAEYAQHVLGSSAEVSILVDAPDALSPAVLTWARQAEDAAVLRYGDQLHPVLSPADLLRFLGTQPTAEQISAATGLLPNYLTTSVVSSDRSRAVMVFGVEMDDLASQRTMLNGIQAALPPPPPGAHVRVVGLPVAAARGYDLISSDRYLVNLAGVVAAGLVLLAALRIRGDALRAVLAGLLATGWGFALLWCLGGSLSPLTLTLGSLTTVTGAEFTVLLTAARRDERPWLRRGVLAACLTSTVGYLALSASQLAALRDFGLLLAASVVLSYVAALAVSWSLPARVRPARPAVRTEQQEVLV